MVKTTESGTLGGNDSPPADPPATASPGISTVEILVRGKKVRVPAVTVQGRTVVITGTWLKTASVFDEEVVDGEVVENPESFLHELAQTRCGADILTFPQRIPETQPKYSYPFEWDNVAVLPITSYDDWYRNRTDANVKRNLKRAAKVGVVTRSSPLDDTFVGASSRSRTRRRSARAPLLALWQDFDTVKAETAHCLDKASSSAPTMATR